MEKVSVARRHRHHLSLLTSPPPFPTHHRFSGRSHLDTLSFSFTLLHGIMAKSKRTRVEDEEDEYFAEDIDVERFDIEADFNYIGNEEPTGEYL